VSAPSALILGFGLASLIGGIVARWLVAKIYREE